ARQRSTASFDAYDSYLRGLELYNQTKMDEAKALFERAISVDTNFAPAYTMLSQALLHMTLDYWKQQHLFLNGLDQAMAAGQRAITLDANDAKGHMAVGAVHFLRKSFDLAAFHLNTARDLNPNDADVMIYASALEAFGDKPERALDLLDRAKKLSLTHP